MQQRNNYDKDVFNGDLGYIREVDTEERTLKVDFDGNGSSTMSRSSTN